MHSNTEGSSPSLAAEHGVGWNRALPAPFGFDKGIDPDGVNDSLFFPSLVGHSFSAVTIELWLRDLNPIPAFLFGMRGDNSGSKVWGLRATEMTPPQGNTIPYPSGFVMGVDNVTKNYFCVQFPKSGQFVLYVNGLSKAEGMMGTWAFPWVPTSFELGQETTGTASYSQSPYDEIRVYDTLIGEDDIQQNYNLGIGNNPAKTEKLLAWIDCNVAESDVALWPGGRPASWPAGVWGLRDKSGKNNHAMQSGMANNATLGGQIVTF